MFGKPKDSDTRKAAVEALKRMVEMGHVSNVKLNGLGFSYCRFTHGNHTLGVRWRRDGEIDELVFDGKTSPLTEPLVKPLSKIVMARLQDDFEQSLAAIVEGCPNE